LNHPSLKGFEITFIRSFLIIFPGALLTYLSTFLPLRIFFHNYFKNKQDLSPEKLDLLKEIELWEKVKVTYSAFPEVLKTFDDKLLELKDKFKHADSNTKTSIEQIEKKYRIKNKVLLVKCLVVLCALLLMFSIESYVQEYIHLSMPWIALFGAVLLLILSDIDDIEKILEETVEWPTML
jgi:hypothetical protein